MTPPVKVKIVNGVRHIVIDRDSVRNALNAETLSGLTSAVNAAGSDSKTCVVLIYGAGDRAFCSGADLEELNAAPTLETRRQFFSGLAALIEAMYGLRKPLVSKVHGWALAGGMGILAASDVVIAAEDARFGLPEIQVGLVPIVVQKALERVINARALSYLSLSAEAIDAKSALAINLVSVVYPKSDLDRLTEEFCEKLALKPPALLAAICESMRAAGRRELATDLHDASLKIAAFSSSSASMSMINSFLSSKRSKKR